jgi:hypothetical protein
LSFDPARNGKERRAPTHRAGYFPFGVLAFLHDVGKANSGFQAKRWKDKRDIPRYWPLHAGHGVEGLKLFEPRLRLAADEPT